MKFEKNPPDSSYLFSLALSFELLTKCKVQSTFCLIEWGEIELEEKHKMMQNAEKLILYWNAPAPVLRNTKN